TDYFEAGTIVVWDVDPLAQTVAVYRATSPENEVIFHLGEIADAEPALPGWRMAVNEVFAV
ncbi:MAG: Uma2 family endonuclease, partial [Pirellulaceae bacterium]|nr:Uma2 family endonuclease [Pirellulaceae bacterium]